MRLHDATAPLDRCACCGKPAAALTVARRCVSCRRSDIRREKVRTANAAKRARMKRRVA